MQGFLGRLRSAQKDIDAKKQDDETQVSAQLGDGLAKRKIVRKASHAEMLKRSTTGLKKEFPVSTLEVNTTRLKHAPTMDSLRFG